MEIRVANFFGRDKIIQDGRKLNGEGEGCDDDTHQENEYHIHYLKNDKENYIPLQGCVFVSWPTVLFETTYYYHY